MATKNIDRLVADELVGPFNTWSSDLLYNGEREEYDKFCSKEYAKIEDEIYFLDGGMRDKIIYNDPEWMRLNREGGTDEECDARLDACELIFEEKFEEAKKELEDKMENLEEEVFERERERIYKNHIEGFMWDQGYRDLSEDDIEYLMSQWRSAFEL